MPRAESGSEDQGVYMYFVAASVQQVTDCYKAEMLKAGWQLGGTGSSATLQPSLTHRGGRVEGREERDAAPDGGVNGESRHQ